MTVAAEAAETSASQKAVGDDEGGRVRRLHRRGRRTGLVAIERLSGTHVHAGVCSQKCSAVFNEEPVNRWALWQSDFIWAKCDLTHKAPMPFECGGGGGPMAVTGLGHDSHYYVNAGGHA